MRMRTGLALAAVILGTLGTGSFAAQDSTTSGSLERTIAANTRIRMDLAAGEYRISGSPENRIRMDWSVRDAESLRKVQAHADLHDKDVRITTDGPSNRGLKFTIL